MTSASSWFCSPCTWWRWERAGDCSCWPFAATRLSSGQVVRMRGRAVVVPRCRPVRRHRAGRSGLRCRARSRRAAGCGRDSHWSTLPFAHGGVSVPASRILPSGLVGHGRCTGEAASPSTAGIVAHDDRRAFVVEVGVVVPSSVLRCDPAIEDRLEVGASVATDQLLEESGAARSRGRTSETPERVHRIARLGEGEARKLHAPAREPGRRCPIEPFGLATREGQATIQLGGQGLGHDRGIARGHRDARGG